MASKDTKLPKNNEGKLVVAVTLSMTTVERHRSTHHLLPSDAPLQSHRSSTSSPSKVVRRIPPAVPSPPRIPSSPPKKVRRERSSSAADMASEEFNQWYFTEAELASTPTIQGGVQPIDERCRRAKGVNFIIQAGIMLKLPQLTLATASVFFHRYFMRMSMDPAKGHHHYNVAATALFLATKTEENCRKTKEIVIAVAKVAQKNPKLLIDEQSKDYWRWRDTLLTLEENMLEMLTFDVVITPPYTYLWRFLHDLQIEDSKPLRNAAWAFINDSCLTPLCLLIPPKDIATAAIYFAAKSTKEPIEDDRDGGPWWDQLGGSLENIVKALNVMNDFWTENPLNRSDNPWVMSPLNDENDSDKTRKPRNDRSVDHTPSRDERRNSIESQNGFSQENGGSVNGNKTTEHTQEAPRSPVKPQDIPAPSTESDNNDPDLPKIFEPSKSTPKATPKRKSRDDDVEEATAKRNKSDGSEEGELGS